MTMVMIVHLVQVMDPFPHERIKLRPRVHKTLVLRRSWIRMRVDDGEVSWQLHRKLGVETIRVYVEKRN